MVSESFRGGAGSRKPEERSRFRISTSIKHSFFFYSYFTVQF